MSFTPPLGPVSSYTVSASPGLASATGTGSPIVVNGLVNGVSYTFTVTATNVGGTGPASSPSNAVTPFGLPGAPTAVSATAGDGYAVITFTPPASNGGAAILWYTVTSLGRPERQRLGQPDRALRADERAELHVHGDGDEQRRTGPAVGGFRVGHARRR